MIFCEMVLCHIKYIETDAFHVYVQVKTDKNTGKAVFLALVMVREKV